MRMIVPSVKIRLLKMASAGGPRVFRSVLRLATSTDSKFFVPHADLRQADAVLLEVGDLDERRPELDRAFDHADHVVHDPQQVLLEKVGFKAIKGLVQVGGEELQGLRPLSALGGL